MNFLSGSRDLVRAADQGVGLRGPGVNASGISAVPAGSEGPHTVITLHLTDNGGVFRTSWLLSPQNLRAGPGRVPVLF